MAASMADQKMNHPICVTCGVQFGGVEPPPNCPVCEDERQFVNWGGQQWTSLDQLRINHSNRFESEGPNLIGIGTEPLFAIGQRALLVQTPGGNLLWDSVSLLDHATISRIHNLGGIRAIAISHPHFYSSMIEWSRAFEDAPIHLHVADRGWVMRDAPSLKFWDGATQHLWDDITLINCGGHFDGGTVLHWPGGADGSGALLTGDTIQVVMDRSWASFMRSYPNLIPLPPPAIRQICERIEPFAFEQVYGGWWKRNVLSGGNQVIKQSAERYLRAIGALP